MRPFIPGWAIGRAALDAAAAGGGGGASIQDTFNRADTTAGLGTSSDGTWSWTDLGNTTGISSNQMYSPNNSGIAIFSRAEIDLASSDHWAQLTSVQQLTSTGWQLAVCARYSAAANTCYMFGWKASANQFAIQKVIAGTATVLGSGSSTTAAGDVLKIVCTGTSIQGFRNGTLDVSVTDSSITTGTRTGIFATAGGSTGFRADSFSAGT